MQYLRLDQMNKAQQPPTDSNATPNPLQFVIQSLSTTNLLATSIAPFSCDNSITTTQSQPLKFCSNLR